MAGCLSKREAQGMDTTRVGMLWDVVRVAAMERVRASSEPVEIRVSFAGWRPEGW